jgi:hypothetical protein
VCIARAFGTSRRQNATQRRRSDAMKNYLARFRFRFAADLKTFDEIRIFCDVDIARAAKNTIENHIAAARHFSLTTIANIQSALQK